MIRGTRHLELSTSSKLTSRESQVLDLIQQMDRKLGQRDWEILTVYFLVCTAFLTLSDIERWSAYVLELLLSKKSPNITCFATRGSILEDPISSVIQFREPWVTRQNGTPHIALTPLPERLSYGWNLSLIILLTLKDLWVCTMQSIWRSIVHKSYQTMARSTDTLNVRGKYWSYALPCQSFHPLDTYAEETFPWVSFFTYGLFHHVLVTS